MMHNRASATQIHLNSQADKEIICFKKIQIDKHMRVLRTCSKSQLRDAAQGKSDRKSVAYTQYVSIL